MIVYNSDLGRNHGCKAALQAVNSGEWSVGIFGFDDFLISPLSARMTTPVHRFEMHMAYTRVNCCGRQESVSHQHLDHSDVCSILSQVSGEAMTEHSGAGVF